VVGITIGCITVFGVIIGNSIFQEEIPDIPRYNETPLLTEISESYSSKELKTEDQVLRFIQNYKGKDNEGDALLTAFEKYVIQSHTGENIFESPVTTVSFSVSEDHKKEISDRYWKVGLELHTYRDISYFEWVVDTETNSVYAGNDEGRGILNILG